MPAHALLYKCPHCGTPHEIEPHREGEVTSCTNPACGKPFQVEVPVAHPAEIINEDHHDLVAPVAETAPTADKRPGLILPPEAVPANQPSNGEAIQGPPMATLAQETLPDETEQIILTARPAMFRRFPGRFLAYVGALIAGIALFIWASTDRTNLWFFELVGVAAAAYGLFYLLPWWFRVHSTCLSVSNHRTLVVQGIFNREKVEIAHQDLDHLVVHQNWFERLMGVGDVDIITAQGKKNVSVMGLPDPQGVANQIRAQHPAVRHAAKAQAAAPTTPSATPAQVGG
jgi:hypothetical protein